ncbi:hypothetical protein HMSSN036_31190 [Paenibacillus macerans]|nr:hypothetical protein HMSSN036_31190 [Paenibacillus macerans]
MNNEISKTTNLILHLIFIVITVLCVLPIVLVFMISITDYDSIVLNGYQFIPDKLSLEAYRYIFKDYGTVVSAYGISFFVTIVGTLLSVLLTSLYAYPLSRGDFRYRGVLLSSCSSRCCSAAAWCRGISCTRRCWI